MEKRRVELKNTNYFDYYQIDDKKRPCAVVVPGGGYHHTSPAEAENVALKFIELGFNAAVLYYRETLDEYPMPQVLLGMTIDIIRNNSEYCALEDKILTIGFSAGAHLVLSNAIYYKEYGFNSRPNFIVLSYPVVTSEEIYAHINSFKLLLGKRYEELKDKMALERHLPDDLAPVFLWHSFTDESVNVMNSLMLAEKMKEKNLSLEMHIFPIGHHGMSLADETTAFRNPNHPNTYIARWFDMLKCWIERNIL